MSVNLSIDGKFLDAESEKHDDIKLMVNGHTVGECLNEYLATNPPLKRDFFNKNGELAETTNVYINKVQVFFDHLNKKIKDGDELRISFYLMMS
jgi:molybdopterin converting factor small subunit